MVRHLAPEEINELKKKAPENLRLGEQVFLLSLEIKELRERLEILEASHIEPSGGC